MSGFAKMQMLLPMLEHLSQGVQPPVQEQLAILLVSCIDGSSLRDLNDTQGGSWEVYKALIHQYFQPG